MAEGKVLFGVGPGLSREKTRSLYNNIHRRYLPATRKQFRLEAFPFVLIL